MRICLSKSSRFSWCAILILPLDTAGSDCENLLGAAFHTMRRGENAVRAKPGVRARQAWRALRRFPRSCAPFAQRTAACTTRA